MTQENKYLVIKCDANYLTISFFLKLMKNTITMYLTVSVKMSKVQTLKL